MSTLMFCLKRTCGFRVVKIEPLPNPPYAPQPKLSEQRNRTREKDVLVLRVQVTIISCNQESPKSLQGSSKSFQDPPQTFPRPQAGPKIDPKSAPNRPNLYANFAGKRIFESVLSRGPRVKGQGSRVEGCGSTVSGWSFSAARFCVLRVHVGL